MTSNYRAVELALLVVLVTVAPPVAAQSDIMAVDTGHDLDEDAKIATFESKGVASGSVDSLNMTVTVADKITQLNRSWWTAASSGRVFLRVDYNEELPRTVRLYIPSEYFRPRVNKGLAPLEDGPAAQFEPTDEREYTAVTIELDGKTDAIYGVSALRGGISTGRSGIFGAVENVTGFEVPSLTTNTADWQPVPETALNSSDATYRIPYNQTNDTELTVQYDAAESTTEERWLIVSSCDGGDQPVCSFQKEGSNSTYLLSMAENPPPVRWKTDASAADTGRFVIDDIGQALADIKDDLGGWFGGD